MGQLMQFPWGAVQRPDELLSCPQLRERGFFRKGEAEQDKALFPGLPFKLSGLQANSWRKAPAVGEHNELVYRDELGLEAGQVAQLSADGII